MYVSSCSKSMPPMRSPVRPSIRTIQTLALIFTTLLISCRSQKKDSDSLISGPAHLAAVSATVAFGNAGVNGTKTATLTINNDGGLLATGVQPKNLAAPFSFVGGIYPGVGGTCTLIIRTGESCDMALVFSPTVSGDATGVLTLTYFNGVDQAATITTDVATLTGTGTNGAVLSISDGTTFDYGTIVVGNTSDKTFTITNTASVTASAMAAGAPPMAAPFTFKGGSYPGTAGTCAATLAAAATCTVIVRYTPTTGVFSNDVLRIGYNDGAASQTTTRTIQGTGQTPSSLAISDAATYTYPDTYQTLTSDKTFTVTNSGGATATSLANTTPALAAPYTYKGGSYPGTAGTCGASLAGAATCTVIVRYAPTATGATSSTINLTYNNGVTTQTASRALAGTGVGYASLSVSDGATYSFGSKYITTTNTDKTFTVTNSLNGSATIVSGAALSAPYAYKGGTYPGTGGTCAATILATASCTIIVTFSPTALGVATATLTVNYTLPDATTSTATRAMTGTGIGNPGTLDTTWNSTGKLSTSIGSADALAYGVAVQSDGKVVAVGSSHNGTNLTFAVARYSTSGALDATFGTAGTTTIDVTAGNSSIAYAVAIQSDGAIIVGGSSGTAANLHFTLVRLTSAGAVDTTYGTSGIASTDFNGRNDVVRAVALDSAGKALAVGYSNSLGNVRRFGIARYKTDGTLDTTFNSTGKATFTPLTSLNDAYALSILSSGSIILAGTGVDALSIQQMVVARISSAGAIDTSFGTSGYKTLAISAGGPDTAKAVAIDSSGNIVVGGVITTGSNQMAVIRLSAAGALDATFGTAGVFTTTIGTGAADGTALKIDSSGNIIIAGFSTTTEKDFALMRLTSAGALDTTFNTTGKIETDYNLSGAANNNSISAMVLQSDGKVLAVGNAQATNYTFAIMRYWP